METQQQKRVGRLQPEYETNQHTPNMRLRQVWEHSEATTHQKMEEAERGDQNNNEKKMREAQSQKPSGKQNTRLREKPTTVTTQQSLKRGYHWKQGGSQRARSVILWKPLPSQRRQTRIHKVDRRNQGNNKKTNWIHGNVHTNIGQH